MRVLLAINGTDFGGTETVLVSIAGELQDRGHHVEVLSLKPPGRVAEQLRGLGISVGTLGMSEKVGLFASIPAVLRLAARLRRGRFDLIHSFLPRANVLTRIANRLSGQCLPHVSREESTDHRRARVVSALNRWTSGWTSVVLAVSPEVRSALTRRDRLPAARVEILENGVDLEAIEREPRADLRRELDLPEHSFLMCAAGRLVPVKGHGYLIDALGELLPRHPSTHLVIVGDGPEEERLRRRSTRMGVDGNVHFLGFRRDLIPLLKAVDLLVLPSLQEGLPLTMLEAMACGVPVAATAVGEIPAVIEHGRSGFLIAPPAPWGEQTTIRSEATAEVPPWPSLVEALTWMVENEQPRGKLARRARAEVVGRYGIAGLVSRLETIYRILLERGGRAPARGASGTRA